MELESQHDCCSLCTFSSVPQRRLILTVTTGRVLRSLQKLLMSSDRDRIPGRKPQHTYESKRKPIFSFLSENDQVFECCVYVLNFYILSCYYWPCFTEAHVGSQ